MSTPDSPDALARREVSRVLKQEVAEKFRQLLPPLAPVPDAYKAIMESPELLDGCFQIFRAKRDLFANLLVDADGNPVHDDVTRLKCGRSVDEVIGMVVRTGMRSFAENHFGEPIDPAKAKTKTAAAQKKPPQQSPLLRLVNVAKLSELFRRNHGQDRPPPAGQSGSGRFYASIKDHLDFEWQVRFFPIYVEIPAHVFNKLGIGITRMDTEERLQKLAQLAMADLQKAEQVLKDPALIREMLEHNVLASSTVSELGEAGFDTVHGALSGVDAKKKWDVLANKDTAKKLVEDNRISQHDIAALADYLDVLNEYALDAMLELHLNRDQMQMFLKTAEEHLGRSLFLSLFGPVYGIVPDDMDEQMKLRKYQSFCQKALRDLVTAVKQLEEQNRRSGNEVDEQECLATVCRSRRIDLEKELKKLVPACVVNNQPHHR
ncbi:MAG TPA: hypothetical protein VM661_18890 [Candidatus Sulfotelmatobacter sp.]|jgi:hypothetical protein|nr:hypothetical protein [Candidatus Sulfotelmatobacter sp.]